jgi:hypothetical protein
LSIGQNPIEAKIIQKVIIQEEVNKIAYQKTLQEHFENSKRDDAIINALEDGYTQANFIGF